MAQSTAGIKLFYGDSTVTGGVPVIPTTWLELPDVVSTPSLNSPPGKLETTTLAEMVQKTYIAGLMDLGGSFEFKCNMTPALVAAAALANAAPITGHANAFSIVFPAPLSSRYWWTGAVAAVVPGEAGVDAVAQTTLYISQATSIAKVAVS